MTIGTRCTKPATVKQQMTHAARLCHLQARESGYAVERYLCPEHADIIDKDWIQVLWAPAKCDHCDGLGCDWCGGECTAEPRQCEWEDEE